MTASASAAAGEERPVQDKIIRNPKCKTCMYRSNTPVFNGCDYMYITGKRRITPVMECDKYAPGDRLHRHAVPPSMQRPNDPTDAYVIQMIQKNIRRRRRAKRR